MKKKRKKSKNRKRNLPQIGLTILGLALILVLANHFFVGPWSVIDDDKTKITKPVVEEDFLTQNPYSRPGKALRIVNGIVVHYVANPQSTARQNRDYFEGLKDSRERKASSHYIIGLDGEIIQCIPLGEISYASNHRNYDTVSIECCHPDESGKFNDKTYESLVHLTAWLCEKYRLDAKDVIRHHDVTGKMCPLYYVQYPDKWDSFLKNISNYH